LAANGRLRSANGSSGDQSTRCNGTSDRWFDDKVLNERLRKLVNYGILQRYGYPEIPLVEYKLTAFGEKFVHILNEIEKLKKSSTV